MENIEKQINLITAEVINEIAESYLKILIDYIEKYVYQPNEPMKYERTNQFLNSFEKLPQAKKVMREIVQEIYFDKAKLNYKQQSSGIWQHGTKNSNYTSQMAEILNSQTLNMKYSQLGGGLNIGTKGFYWDEFLKYIDENLVKDIQTAFRKKGVMLK